MEQYYIARTEKLPETVIEDADEARSTDTSDEILIDATFNEESLDTSCPKTASLKESVPAIFFEKPHKVRKSSSDFKRIVLCELVISTILLIVVATQSLGGNVDFCNCINQYLSVITIL